METMKLGTGKLTTDTRQRGTLMRLVQLAELLKGELRGEKLDEAKELDVYGVSSAKRATESSVVFAEDAEALMDALGSGAAAVIV